MKKYILILMLFVSPVQAQTTIKEYYEPLGYYTQLSSVNTLNTVGIVTEIEAETAIEKEPSGIISAFKNASNGHVIVKFAYRVMHSASTWWNQTDQSLIKTKPAIDVPLSLSMVSSSDYDFAVIGREVQIPDNILQALAEETLTDPDSISCAALLDFGYVLPCQYPPLLAGEDTSPLGTCKNGTAATYNDQTTIGTNWTISQCLNAIDSRYHLYTGASNPRLARTTCSGTSTKTIRIYMRWDTAQSSFMDIGHFRWTTPEPCFQVMLADPISTHVQGSYDYKNPTTGIPEPDESFTLDML
ncbi:MAG: hypothetical protein Q8L06_09250, partial [Pseudohongiella sp.]|nr:hypothetical protein [Pseudohongiella sp.]